MVSSCVNNKYGLVVLTYSYDISLLILAIDIWGQWDQFQFHYDSIPARGDVSVEMFIQDFSTDDWYGKGGLMFRDSVAGNSQHYSLFMTQDGNVMANQWRECTNCGSSSNKSPTIKDRSGWIKITNTGNVFEAFFKRVGTTEWIKHGSTKTIDFSSDHFYVGVAVTAHDRTKTATLRGSDLSIDGYFTTSLAHLLQYLLCHPLLRYAKAIIQVCFVIFSHLYSL